METPQWTDQAKSIEGVFWGNSGRGGVWITPQKLGLPLHSAIEHPETVGFQCLKVARSGFSPEVDMNWSVVSIGKAPWSWAEEPKSWRELRCCVSVMSVKICWRLILRLFKTWTHRQGSWSGAFGLCRQVQSPDFLFAFVGLHLRQAWERQGRCGVSLTLDISV